MERTSPMRGQSFKINQGFIEEGEDDSVNHD